MRCRTVENERRAPPWQGALPRENNVSPRKQVPLSRVKCRFQLSSTNLDVEAGTRRQGAYDPVCERAAYPE